MLSERGSRLPTQHVAVPGRAQDSGRLLATNLLAETFVAAGSDDGESLTYC